MRTIRNQKKKQDTIFTKLFMSIFIFSLIIILNIFSIQSKAQIIQNQVVDNNKTWTIKLKNPIVYNEAIKAITVQNIDTNIIENGISIIIYTDKVLVKPPTNNYINGGHYKLNISKDLLDVSGKTFLSKDVSLNFSIKESSATSSSLTTQSIKTDNTSVSSISNGSNTTSSQAINITQNIWINSIPHLPTIVKGDNSKDIEIQGWYYLGKFISESDIKTCDEDVHYDLVGKVKNSDDKVYLTVNIVKRPLQVDAYVQILNDSKSNDKLIQVSGIFHSNKYKVSVNGVNIPLIPNYKEGDDIEFEGFISNTDISKLTREYMNEHLVIKDDNGVEVNHMEKLDEIESIPDIEGITVLQGLPLNKSDLPQYAKVIMKDKSQRLIRTFFYVYNATGNINTSQVGKIELYGTTAGFTAKYFKYTINVVGTDY